jgi:hypothetical protein
LRRRAAVASLLLASLLAGSRARAQTAPECDRKLGEIRTVLDDDARRTRVWYWAWMGIGSTLFVGQTALAAVTTDNLQKEFAVGAFASAFVPGILLLHPPRVLSDAPLLRDRAALTTVDGRVGDPCVVLLRARELLERNADDEAIETSWLNHVFVIGGDIFLGLVLGLGFHDWAGAAKQAIGGSIVGEVQILTYPGGALKARALGLTATW